MEKYYYIIFFFRISRIQKGSSSILSKNTDRVIRLDCKMINDLRDVCSFRRYSFSPMILNFKRVGTIFYYATNDGNAVTICRMQVRISTTIAQAKLNFCRASYKRSLVRNFYDYNMKSISNFVPSLINVRRLLPRCCHINPCQYY